MLRCKTLKITSLSGLLSTVTGHFPNYLWSTGSWDTTWSFLTLKNRRKKNPQKRLHVVSGNSFLVFPPHFLTLSSILFHILSPTLIGQLPTFTALVATTGVWWETGLPCSYFDTPYLITTWLRGKSQKTGAQTANADVPTTFQNTLPTTNRPPDKTGTISHVALPIMMIGKWGQSKTCSLGFLLFPADTWYICMLAVKCLSCEM